MTISVNDSTINDLELVVWGFINNGLVKFIDITL